MILFYSTIIIRLQGKYTKLGGANVPLLIKFSRSTMPANWLRGTVVERRSLAGELPLSCARPAADG